MKRGTISKKLAAKLVYVTSNRHPHWRYSIVCQKYDSQAVYPFASLDGLTFDNFRAAQTVVNAVREAIHGKPY